jgi:hypothetical protein
LREADLPQLCRFAHGGDTICAMSRHFVIIVVIVVCVAAAAQKSQPPSADQLAAIAARGAQPNQGKERASVLNSPVDDKTTVRFFYDPPGDYFHYPLVFRVVEEGNPLLNTASMQKEGQTAYISLSEMRELVRLLAHSGLRWQESETVEVFGSYKKLALAGVGLDAMDVRVVTSRGTAKAEVSPKDICTLKPLDAALKGPRILCEFQAFRINYGCKVPGFKYGACGDR